MRSTDKNTNSIGEDGYSYVKNQYLKIGTHIFSLGTLAENYKIFENIITDEMKVDEHGYLCVVLQDVDINIRSLERIELLVCSLHTRTNDFLTREEAEKERQLRLKTLVENR